MYSRIAFKDAINQNSYREVRAQDATEALVKGRGAAVSSAAAGGSGGGGGGGVSSLFGSGEGSGEGPEEGHGEGPHRGR